LSVRQGDRVAGLLVNGPAFLQTMFATAKLGAVFVPINFRLAPPEGHQSPSSTGLGASS
jgi:acyl-CoA synthetase (AMP-forming)/AMP-acid ligase II